MSLYDVTIGGCGGVELRTSRHRVTRACADTADAWRAAQSPRDLARLCEGIARDRAAAKRWGRSCSWHGEHGDAQRGQVVSPARGGGLDCVTPTTIARVTRVAS